MTIEAEPVAGAVAEGRGAWTLRGKENGMTSYGMVPGTEVTEYDGATPSVSDWHDRVYRGVRAIDQLLSLAGYPAEDGKRVQVFGMALRDRALVFQASVGIASTRGYVGPMTMRALVIPHARSVALEFGIAPRWILAQVEKESGFDPGAQGWLTPFDSGLVQCNTQDTSVTLDQAYNPIKALRIGARRWRDSRDGFLAVCEAAGTPRKVAIDGAILQHKNPEGARIYVESGGETWSDESQEYVLLTREFARGWQKALAG